MKSVTEKLSAIDHDAISIVEGAEAKKQQLEQEMHKKREQFDADLEARTNEKLLKIKANIEQEIEENCKKEDEKTARQIANRKNDFAQNHSIYAKEILNRIIEG